MNLGIIVQARLGSTRLPNKILLPFYEEQCILDILLEKLQTFNDITYIVATTTNVSDDKLVCFLKSKNIFFYRGNEEDVLERFIFAAEKYNVDSIIRICSDNPFLDISGLQSLIEIARKSKEDYIGFKINNTPSIKTHFGFWAEYVTLNALKKVNRTTKENLYHEHVTNYIYTHPELFKIKWIDTPSYLQNRNDIRLTIDTSSDFENANKIYLALKNNNKIITLKNIIDYLDDNHSCLVSMKQEIQKNSK